MSTDFIGDLRCRGRITQERARKALPILVQLAMDGGPAYVERGRQRTTYGDIASQIGTIGFKMNGPLDCVARALMALTSTVAESVPAITSLIVNKRTQYPGDGIGQYLGDLLAWHKLPTEEQHRSIEAEWIKVYAFTAWPEVLRALGLSLGEES